jgi:uncharacterized SAM-binding protein YcdF (DUF218 family)
VYSLIKQLLLPPTNLWLLFIIGWLGRYRFKRLSQMLMRVSFVLLICLSLPLTGSSLIITLQHYPALSLQHQPASLSTAQAIVVIGADTLPISEFERGSNIGTLSLQRVHYAAWLQRHTGLPIIVSGGSLNSDDHSSLAHYMAQVLQEDLQATVAMLEEQSTTTWENAFFTAAQLKPIAINHIALVTHSWHMPRAVFAFEQAGLQVTPAPTVFIKPDPLDQLLFNLIPRANALQWSYWACHEYMGMMWYRIRSLVNQHNEH